MNGTCLGIVLSAPVFKGGKAQQMICCVTHRYALPMALPCAHAHSLASSYKAPPPARLYCHAYKGSGIPPSQQLYA
jgi:hypothetical protein